MFKTIVKSCSTIVSAQNEAQFFPHVFFDTAAPPLEQDSHFLGHGHVRIPITHGAGSINSIACIKQTYIEACVHGFIQEMAMVSGLVGFITFMLNNMFVKS